MTQRSPKLPRDPNQLAKMIVDIATEEREPSVSQSTMPGSPGGKRRAEILPKDKRVEIARKGATARWAKISDPTSSGQD